MVGNYHKEKNFGEKKCNTMAIVGDSVLRNTIFVLAGACEALNETFTHLNHKY